jgi:hypothetical protein
MFMNIMYALEGHLEHPFAVDGIRQTGTRTQISVLNHQFKDMQCIIVRPRPREDGAPYLWELFDRKRMRMRIDHHFSLATFIFPRLFSEQKGASFGQLDTIETFSCLQKREWT